MSPTTSAVPTLAAAPAPSAPIWGPDRAPAVPPACSQAGTPGRHTPGSTHLRAALARLAATDEVPSWVRQHIGASWQRSLRSGLRPDVLDIPYVADVDEDAPLVRAARPVLDQLAADLSGSRVAVLLTNDRGQVLDRRASESSLTAVLDRMKLARGYVFAEDAVGTNGMGTALAQRAPVAVAGDEHFADALTSVACAGAPITDPSTGRILGVIDLTCLTGERSELMLPFAVAAARDIAQRLVDDGRLSERLAMQRFLQERRGAKGPLVFLTPRTMITNASADRLVRPEDEPLLRKAAGPITEDGSGASEVTLSSGAEVSIRVERVVEGGFDAGTMLRLWPADGGSRADSRAASFGWDSLTPTERSVVALVAQGLTNRDAGERLFLSHHTVGFHLRSIYRKLNATSRVDMTRLALEHDLLDPSVPKGA